MLGRILGTSCEKPLKKILGRSILSFDELRTVLVEIEGVINSRPLTYVYDDEQSISYPLTLSELIYGRRITSAPNAAHYEVISTNHSLTKKLVIIDRFFNTSPIIGVEST